MHERGTRFPTRLAPASAIGDDRDHHAQILARAVEPAEEEVRLFATQNCSSATRPELPLWTLCRHWPPKRQFVSGSRKRTLRGDLRRCFHPVALQKFPLGEQAVPDRKQTSKTFRHQPVTRRPLSVDRRRRQISTDAPALDRRGTLGTCARISPLPNCTERNFGLGAVRCTFITWPRQQVPRTCSGERVNSRLRIQRQRSFQ
jgi:hypothetical protein